jgi:hypothetical protein
VVEVEGLETVVGADSVAGGLGAEAGALGGFIGVVTAMLVSRSDESVVGGFRDYEVGFGHG